jgi:pimeloyl-ACP methyl ester carboxylesterase
VIAFDGPGQGGARTKYGLLFEHDWEFPVGAVLDHFGLTSAAVVGLSMGGYWAIRAAAHEPRISAVAAWPPVYDWLERVPSVVRPAVPPMLARRGFMTWSIRLRTRLSPTLRYVVEHVQYLIGSDDPYEIVPWFLGMNADHVGSGRVEQPVALLVGEHDSFQPPKLARRQAEALVRAESVTTRVFTKSEQADQHCQMGNLALATGWLSSWLRNVDAVRRSSAD